MYRQFGNSDYRNGFAGQGHDSLTIAQSGQLDALVALERIGTRLSFSRNDEIYAEGDERGLLVQGRLRNGSDLQASRRWPAPHCRVLLQRRLLRNRQRAANASYSAEAVDDVIVMRFRRKATEQLIDQNPMLARLLRDTMLRDLASAHGRTLLLGRMTAPERVAAFLLEMFERRDRTKALDLPMSRNDIADYLGLTIETVCRTLSSVQARRRHRDSEPASDRAARSGRSRGDR